MSTRANPDRAAYRSGSRAGFVVCGLLALAALAVGCGVEDRLSGLWEAQPNDLRILATEGPRYLDVAGCGPLAGARVEMVLGQYGRDVAGVIKLYDRALDARAVCDCSLVYDGRFEGGVLTFKFLGCAPDGETTTMSAELELHDSGTPVLSGKLFAGDVTEGVDAYAELDLRFGGDEKSLSLYHKKCEPLDPGTHTVPDCGGGGDADARGD